MKASHLCARVNESFAKPWRAMPPSEKSKVGEAVVRLIDTIAGVVTALSAQLGGAEPATVRAAPRRSTIAARRAPRKKKRKAKKGKDL